MPSAQILLLLLRPLHPSAKSTDHHEPLQMLRFMTINIPSGPWWSQWASTQLCAGPLRPMSARRPFDNWGILAVTLKKFQFKRSSVINQKTWNYKFVGTHTSQGISQYNKQFSVIRREKISIYTNHASETLILTLILILILKRLNKKTLSGETL